MYRNINLLHNLKLASTCHKEAVCYYMCSYNVNSCVLKGDQQQEMYKIWNLCNFAQVSYFVHFQQVQQQNRTITSVYYFRNII